MDQMKAFLHFSFVLCSFWFVSCLPASRLNNSLWDDIEKGNSTILLATTTKTDGKWIYNLSSFIKNECNVSAESVQESLRLLTRPVGKSKLSSQVVIVLHEPTKAVSAYYVSEETDRISVENDFVELSYIVKRTGK